MRNFARLHRAPSVARTLVCLAAVLIAAGTSRAQSVDEVIAKNIQAHGGLDKIAP